MLGVGGKKRSGRVNSPGSRRSVERDADQSTSGDLDDLLAETGRSNMKGPGGIIVHICMIWLDPEIAAEKAKEKEEQQRKIREQQEEKDRLEKEHAKKKVCV